MKQHRTSVEFRISAQFKLIAEKVLKAYYEGKAETMPIRLMVGGQCISRCYSNSSGTNQHKGA